jgi:hypothetical protein
LGFIGSTAWKKPSSDKDDGGRDCATVGRGGEGDVDGVGIAVVLLVEVVVAVVAAAAAAANDVTPTSLIAAATVGATFSTFPPPAPAPPGRASREVNRELK